jgi:ABC-2 type transport system permease protein
VIRTLKAEWIKISTILAHKILVLIAIVFPIAIGVLVGIFGDIGTDTQSIDIAEFVFGVCVVPIMLLGVVAVISLTSEYTHNTIRPTYAATPIRARVLLAKLIVSSLVSLIVAAVVIMVTFLLTGTILNSRGADVSIGDELVITVLVATIVLAVLVTWFGFGLGLLIRNSPATVSIVLLWPLLIEGLLSLLVSLIGPDSLTKWAPYQAALSATSAHPDSDSLGRPGGQLLFAAVSAALIALGIWLDNRRDA